MNLLYGLNWFHRIGRIKVEASWLVFKQLHRFWTILCTTKQQNNNNSLHVIMIRNHQQAHPRQIKSLHYPTASDTTSNTF